MMMLPVFLKLILMLLLLVDLLNLWLQVLNVFLLEERVNARELIR